MPLTPAQLNLDLVTGLIFGPITLKAQDVNNNPVNLTGWEAFAQVRPKPGGTIILDLTPSITDPVNGVITIPKMTDEATYNLKIGNFNWDLILEDPTGDRRGIYIQGSFNITGSITKPLEGI